MTPSDRPRRVAVVTGAASGIAQAICVRLASDDLVTVGLDRSDQSETARIVESVGGSHHSFRVELSDRADIATVVAAVSDEVGACDVLVNAAAIDDPGDFADFEIEHWDAVLAVNATAPLLLIQRFLPLLTRSGAGRIINIASGSVVNQMTGLVAYRASKMAIIGITRALSAELGALGITVNTVSPGLTDTPLSRRFMDDDDFARAIARQGVKRTGVPADIAPAVAFLASDEAGFVTGQNLLVNGGLAYG